MTLAEFVNVIGFKVDQSSVNAVNSTMSDIKSKAANLLGKIGIGLSVVGMGVAVKQCIALASEAEEMQNKFDTVFSGMTNTVEDWAKKYADSIGRSTNDVKTYLADAQNLMVGFMGTENRQAAYEMSKNMTTLAMDLASFANIDEGIAINAMQKAVMGETESAKTLGAVLTDVTRAQAMETLGLKGKYEALDQVQKMQVNYQAILQQSPDAIGDCERSINSYRSTLISFQAKLTEIKTLVGQFFMPAAQKVIKFGAWLLTFARNAVMRLNQFADSVGGSERILAVLAATFALFFAYQKWNTMIAGAKGVLALLKGLNVQTMLLFAKFLLLALIVDDLIAFVQGRDSLFGTLLEKAGVDTDALRDKIKAAGKYIKETFKSLGENQGFLKILGIAVGAIMGILTAAKAASSATKIFKLISGAVKGVGAAIGFLTSPVGIAIMVIAALVAVGVLLYKNWDKIKAKASELYQRGSEAFQNLQTAITEKANAIRDKGNAAFSNLVEGIKSKCGGIRDTVVNGFEAAVAYITSLPSRAFTWGSDIISNIVNGITSGIDRVKAAASNIASTIKSFIGFSVPETGPLSNFETYMPDMIDLLVQGITNGEGPVGAAISKLTANMSSLISSGTVSAATRSGIYNSTSNRSVTQNVSFRNTFNGEPAVQKNASKVMNQASHDTTAELARGLAFAR